MEPKSFYFSLPTSVRLVCFILLLFFIFMGSALIITFSFSFLNIFGLASAIILIIWFLVLNYDVHRKFEIKGYILTEYFLWFKKNVDLSSKFIMEKRPTSWLTNFAQGELVTISANEKVVINFWNYNRKGTNSFYNALLELSSNQHVL